jgi:hypothetical protein
VELLVEIAGHSKMLFGIFAARFSTGFFSSRWVHLYRADGRESITTSQRPGIALRSHKDKKAAGYIRAIRGRGCHANKVHE